VVAFERVAPGRELGERGCIAIDQRDRAIGAEGDQTCGMGEFVALKAGACSVLGHRCGEGTNAILRKSPKIGMSNAPDGVVLVRETREQRGLVTKAGEAGLG
jgi:hypothetical protein